MIALVPAIVPFVFMDDPRRALRVSNLLVVLTMAAVGWTWGRAAHLSPWRSSATLLAIGLTMVAVAVVFGG
jgi:VIT1/CCC1 family predicted Fe2+/Mn2+ transporter